MDTGHFYFLSDQYFIDFPSTFEDDKYENMAEVL